MNHILGLNQPILISTPISQGLMQFVALWSRLRTMWWETESELVNSFKIMTHLEKGPLRQPSLEPPFTPKNFNWQRKNINSSKTISDAPKIHWRSDISISMKKLRKYSQKRILRRTPKRHCPPTTLHQFWMLKRPWLRLRSKNFTFAWQELAQMWDIVDC